MYEELITALRQIQNWDAMDFDDETGYAIEIIGEAADAIEKLNVFNLMWQEAAKIAHEAEPKWIPVTARLPGSGVPTLICGDGNVVEQGFFDDECGYWYDWGGNRTFVHHWMPLPNPPMEVDG